MKRNPVNGLRFFYDLGEQKGEQILLFLWRFTVTKYSFVAPCNMAFNLIGRSFHFALLFKCVSCTTKCLTEQVFLQWRKSMFLMFG
jgi:hypothetical protein